MTTDDPTPTPTPTPDTMTPAEAQAITRPHRSQGFDPETALRRIVGTDGIVLGMLADGRGIKVAQGREPLRAADLIHANTTVQRAILDLATSCVQGGDEPEFVNMKIADARIIARVVSPRGRRHPSVLVLVMPIGHQVIKSVLRVFRQFASGLRKSESF